MDEFRNLPWTVQDAGTNLEECYALNMNDYSSKNPYDVFFNNLFEINPIHYNHIDQCTSNTNESTNENCIASPRKFLDPRTGVEIENHFCRYSTVDRTKFNIFLKNYIEVSKLKRVEHVSGLNAIRCLSKNLEDLSSEERADRLVYEMTEKQRSDEKQIFLDKVRENFQAKKSIRYNFVPAALNYFIIQVWKRRLIELRRKTSGIYYRLSTAMNFSSNAVDIRMELLHKENVGNVPALSSQNVRYVLQSSANLMKIYHEESNIEFQNLVERKTNELIQNCRIDFVLPLSTLILVLCDEKNWQFRMSVEECETNSLFDSKKRVNFEKPLPDLYMDGYSRYRYGAKYLLRSRLCQNSMNVFNHTENKDCPTGVSAANNEYEAKEIDKREFEVSTFDDFMANYLAKVPAAAKYTRRNGSFSVFELCGKDEEHDSNEMFRILITSNQDAYRRSETGDVEYLNFSPKIERQPEYGCEVVTKSELLQEWCQLVFMPDSVVERVRFDYETGKIMHRQSFHITDIERQLEQQFGIVRLQILKKLWAMLETLYEFPPGDYILQKSSKSSSSIKVYEKTIKSSETTSISDLFKNVEFEKNLFDEVHWLAIDDKLITELHEKHQILPCTFPHSEYLLENNIKPIQETKVRYVKAGPSKPLTICPKDDSQTRLNRTALEKNKQKRFLSQKKLEKKQRYRRKRAEQRAAIKSKLDEETKGLAQAEDILIKTMDQYSTLSGNDLVDELFTGNPKRKDSIDPDPGSIAKRTRRHSRTAISPQKDNSPKVQYTVRRSDRVPKIKRNLDL